MGKGKYIILAALNICMEIKWALALFSIQTHQKKKNDDGPETRHNTFDLEAGKDLLGRTENTSKEWKRKKMTT